MASKQQLAGEQADKMITDLAALRVVAYPAEAGEPVVTAPAIVEQPVDDVPSDVSVQAASPLVVEPDALALSRKEVETANQRWQVLQGMIGKKDSEIEQMRTLLAQLSRAAEAPEIPPASLVSEKDVDTFGTDMVDFVVRQSTEVFKLQIKKVYDLIAKLESTLGSVSETSSRVAAETFDEALTRQVPNWKDINTSSEFLTWLAEEEGFTGRTKLELLQDAYTAGKLNLTVRFFKAFQEASSPATVAPVRPATPVASAEKFVTPGKSKASVTPMVAPSNAKVWSKAEISKLYNDKRNRLITAEEFAAEEADLFKAQGDGRIAA